MNSAVWDITVLNRRGSTNDGGLGLEPMFVPSAALDACLCRTFTPRVELGRWRALLCLPRDDIFPPVGLFVNDTQQDLDAKRTGTPGLL
jgi:hypothetical protein